MSAPRWADGLTAAGLYYDGVVDKSKLQDTLELHRRDTVSTFGTRSSRRVSKHTKSEPLGETQVVTKGQCDLPNSDTTNLDTTSESSKENIEPQPGKLLVILLSQRVHPEIIAKIHELVSIGTVEPVEVQRLLKHHVNHYMCSGNLPDPNEWQGILPLSRWYQEPYR